MNFCLQSKVGCKCIIPSYVTVTLSICQYRMLHILLASLYVFLLWHIYLQPIYCYSVLLLILLLLLFQYIIINNILQVDIVWHSQVFPVDRCQYASQVIYFFSKILFSPKRHKWSIGIIGIHQITAFAEICGGRCRSLYSTLRERSLIHQITCVNSR